MGCCLKHSFTKRSAGILLPISSLPSNYGIGTFGKDAYEFVDFLRNSNQQYWQMLPLGPTSFGDSPYQSFSAFAGNPYYIDLDILCEEGLLNKDEITAFDWGCNETDVDYKKLFDSRFIVLRSAFNRFDRNLEAFNNFKKENEYWLYDYSFYMALKFRFDNKDWLQWDEGIRMRTPDALNHYSLELGEEIEFFSFIQFKFFEQWNKLKEYATKSNVKIIGDMPIYVSMDSADAWVNTKLFLFDENKRPVKVAGVPPDIFSETGQLWGNPLYNWTEMEKDDFSWWKKRVEFATKFYDVIRIDHFIGIVRFYTVDAGRDNAMEGTWEPGPGIKLINAINSVIGSTSIIAEDLGVVTQEVIDLLEATGLPNMKVMQFGFDTRADNDHKPFNYKENCVVYGGTHDNNTMFGYFNEQTYGQKQYIMNYLNAKSEHDVAWSAIKVGYNSVAKLAIFQMQDFIALDSSARINTPSTVGINWRWRLKKGQYNNELAIEISKLVEMYGRGHAKN